MTRVFRVAATVTGLLAVAFSAAGCMGPTYGTDKSSTEHLVDDLGDAFSITPAKKEVLPYQPRGALVKPANDKVLVAPQKNLANKENNPAWVESPEEARARLRAEADENSNNGNYRSPLMVSVTEGKALSPEEQRKAYRDARAIQDGRYSDRRRFMSDPPLEYRKVEDPAKLTDLGESEVAKEKRRKKDAEIAGTGRQWWQVFSD